MKKSSLWLSALGALAVAVALAGCGKTFYFAGRVLPPSGLRNRVLVAIQNASAGSKGSLEILDAYYDIRYAYNNPNTDPTNTNFGRVTTAVASAGAMRFFSVGARFTF